MPDPKLYVIKIVCIGDSKLLPGEIAIEYYNQHGNTEFRFDSDPMERAREFFCNKAKPSRYSKCWALEQKEIVQYHLNELGSDHNNRARKMDDWRDRNHRVEFFATIVRWNTRRFERDRELKLQRSDSRAVKLRASEKAMFHQLQAVHPIITDNLDEQYPIRS